MLVAFERNGKPFGQPEDGCHVGHVADNVNRATGAGVGEGVFLDEGGDVGAEEFSDVFLESFFEEDFVEDLEEEEEDKRARRSVPIHDFLLLRFWKKWPCLTLDRASCFFCSSQPSMNSWPSVQFVTAAWYMVRKVARSSKIFLQASWV